MDDKKDVQGKQFAVLKLGSEDYGLDIQNITTIEKMMHTARVPKTPCFIKGVINLRGEIIPVMDLSARFNLPEFIETEETRIIILKIGESSLGIIVGEVEDVLYLTQDSIESVSNYSSDLSMDFILGVGKVDERIITLLNVEKLADFIDTDIVGG